MFFICSRDSRGKRRNEMSFVTDTDLAATAPGQGADMVGFILKDGVTAAVPRTAMEKLRETVSVLDFGAIPGAADNTAAIQAALDSGATSIYFPDGEYRHGDLVVHKEYQRLFGPGASLVRTVPNSTITIPFEARGVHFSEMRFGCYPPGLAGNNITVRAPDFRAFLCESRDCGGRALLVLNAGGGVIVYGGVYQTTDGDGYDIEFRHDDDTHSQSTLYCWVSNIITNHHQGGILFTGKVGTSAIDGCEFGKLRMENGGAAKVDNCRVGGVATILSNFASFTQNDFNDDILVGQSGAGTNIGSIRFDSTNVQKTGKAFRIGANVVESVFHLGQLASSGSVIAIDNYNNDIWHPEFDVQIPIRAASGSPTSGNGALVARMASAGRRRILSVDFTLGSTSNLGGGNFFYLVAPFQAKSSTIGTGFALDAGTGYYGLVARQLAGSDQIYFFPTSGGTSPVAVGANAANPFAWQAGDRLIFSIDVEQTF